MLSVCEREREGEECTSHFSHKQHPLFFYRVASDDYRPFHCNACGEDFSMYEVYISCPRCPNIFLHKVCAEIPRELKHFFHPHKLTLLLSEPPWTKDAETDVRPCSACGLFIIRSFFYACSTCKFYLHIKCSLLILIRRSSTNHQQLCHPHPLFLCKGDFNFFCRGCGTQAKCEAGDYLRAYVCLECNGFFHESCGDLPQRITHHPFHPDCTFTLDNTPDEGKSYSHCHFCGHFCGLHFECSDCSKKMDFRCALLTFPTNQSSKHNFEENRGHPHPVIHCNSHVNHYGVRYCIGCREPVENNFCYCVTCKTFLHKSCADLPHQIRHPLHPQHSLTLSDSLDHLRRKEFYCKACWKYGYGSNEFSCRCDLCKFYLHLKCASPLLYPMIYMSELHQHPLTYFDKVPDSSGCSKCSDAAFTSAGFRCLQCKFYIHDHCLPLLPPTVKTKWHRHPLTLTYDPIKDDPDEDEKAYFYCDCCQEKRDLKHPTYYCAECHLISHVHCVMLEVMDYLQGKSTKVEELCNTKVIGIGEANAIDSIYAAAGNKDGMEQGAMEEGSEHSVIGLRNQIVAVSAELVEHKAQLEKYHKIYATTYLKLKELKERLLNVLRIQN